MTTLRGLQHGEQAGRGQSPGRPAWLVVRIVAIGAALLALAAVLHAAANGWAAEIQLKAQCSCQSSLVYLADVAGIYAADPRQIELLGRLELFPAPPAGQKRYVELREIQDLLLLRGVSLVEHRFSGVGQVVVLGPGSEVGTVAKTEQREKRLPPVDSRKATRCVRESLAKYLRQAAAARQTFDLEFELSESQARAVTQPNQQLRVSGGKAPWTGQQTFQIAVAGGGEPSEFQLEVRVARPPVVAVAARALSRGTVVRPEDVQLIGASVAIEQGEPLRSVEDVVGRETTRAIGEGHAFERNAVRAPIMVRRGDVVTIYARTAGIRVRTVARAKDDAGLGELVSVESLQDRKTFLARVSGIQEAEVYAQAVQAVPAEPATARADGNSVR